MVFGGFVLLFISQVISSGAYGAVEPTVKPQTYVLCKNKGTVRTIRVDASEAGCATTYTKAGVDRVIGSGSNQAACQKFVENVKVNLESANWQCRDIKDAKITAESAAGND